MSPRRRAALLAAAGLAIDVRAGPSATPADDGAVRRGRTLVFPRDHGAHTTSRIEWWYTTGWLRAAGREGLIGFQVTFFRSRTGLAETLQSRFAPRQLLFAHAAVTDVAAGRHVHADRVARWSGDTAALRAVASSADTHVVLDDWHLERHGRGPAGALYEAAVAGPGFDLALQLQPTQPVLLQGDAGFSRKGPQETQASHYVSEPQLAVAGRVTLNGRAWDVQGRGWLDHEWSDELLHPQAVGWDWIGMNLDDGGALTAFRLRRADGSVLWAGGSWRASGGHTRAFGPDDVRFTAGRSWRSPGSNATYPVEWQVQTPMGRFTVRALLDAQELDSRASTGSVYWEGLSELLDPQGRRTGLGYLEMTGYVAALRL